MAKGCDKSKQKHIRALELEKFYVFDEEAKLSKCRSCGLNIKGFHKWNLLRHLERGVKGNTHSELANDRQFLELVRAKTTRICSSSCSANARIHALIMACVELITVNGRPFSLFEDSGFKKILQPLLEFFPKKPIINSRSIPKYIKQMASSYRLELKEELKGKMLSLKIDGVSRHSKSIIGVNAQYVRDGKIFIRTLAMQTLTEKHTGK